MKSFWRVLKVARRHSAWLGVALVSMVLVAGATVFAYNLIRPIYDELLHPGAAATSASVVEKAGPGLVKTLDAAAKEAQDALAHWTHNDRRAILLLVILSLLVKNTFSFLARYSIANLGLSTIRELRDMLADALLVQSTGFFQRTPSGVLLSRVISDVQVIHQALAERFGDLIQDLLTLVVLLVYAFSLNFKLALVTILIAPVLVTPIVHFSRRLRRRSRQTQERMGDLSSALSEIVHGIRVIQAFGMEEFERRQFRRATHRHFWASLKARAIQAANAPVMEMLGAIGFALLIGYASHAISDGSMTLGDFSAFLIAMYGTYSPLKRLNQFNLALQQAVVASDRVYEVIDASVTIADRPGARELAGVAGGIELDDVWFSYEEGAWVLSGLNLTIPEGKTVALVGPSGGGKTTVAQLIPRFWDVTKGSVRVGGEDVRDVTLASLRAMIGLVTQETILFNDTVRSNIAFGREDASQEAIEVAARAAFAHDFIEELPEGYDTVIGESGLKLSGGQRQRLAIARALFKDPP
ncbi:MAG: ABC transporter ATP-binding protein, partial [Gammaproteobacteria bacterium]